MQLIRKLLKTAEIKGKNLRQELQRFLLQYRSTPHQTTKVAPSELLFNRKIKGYLPELTHKKVINKHKMAKTNLEKKKEENKEYYDRNRRAKEADIKTGDTVICKQEKKNKLTPKFDPKHYTIVQRKYNMVTAKRDDGKTLTRSVSFFKKVFMDKSEDEEEDFIERPETDQVLKQEPSSRRSTRIKKPVNRYEHGN